MLLYYFSRIASAWFKDETDGENALSDWATQQVLQISAEYSCLSSAAVVVTGASEKVKIGDASFFS
jgi:hypothetical protein